MKRLVTIAMVLILFGSFAGCKEVQSEGRDVSSNPTETAEGAGALEGNEELTQHVCVDWNDFIKLDGVSYRGDWRVTEVATDLIGEKIGEVTCGVPTVYTDGAGNMSSMEPEDGAAFICKIGTEIFSVIGNDNVIAAYVDGKYYLYVSREHPAGFIGGNLYVIVNGQLFVYEQYQPGNSDLTKNSVLGSFEAETEIEGVVWEVYSTEEYPDLSYVLVISGTNAAWTYRAKYLS